MKNITDKIISCLQQSIDRPSIYKFYKYSIEELQDNPDRLKEIADYLLLHQKKYEDFEIDTWIEEDTFKPVIMLRLYISKDYGKYIVTSRVQKLIQYFSTLQD